MGLAHSPRIVTDNLVLALDAANVKSYPGSGTTWTDLSGKGNNGTLTGGPTYGSDNGGFFEFDGDNDYVDLGTISTSNPLQMDDPSGGGLTISWWGYFDDAGDYLQRIFEKSNGTGASNGWGIFTSATGSGTTHINLNHGGVSSQRVSTSYLDSTWQNWCITWVKSSGTYVTYLNGVQDDTGTRTYSIPSAQTNARIGSWNHSTGREYDGKIANLSIYDKALTAAEVKQNFNALRGRYGI